MTMSKVSFPLGLPKRLRLLVCGVMIAVAPAAALSFTPGSAVGADPAAGVSARPTFTSPAAFDKSKPLTQLAAEQRRATEPRMRPERGAGADRADGSHAPDAALQSSVSTASIPGTIANFEGLNNDDNFAAFGFRVNPPDPIGDVGPNHYVEMVNLTFAVFSKSGTKLLGPVPTGALWSGFAVDECTDPSGDGMVLYDQIADRWILSQFTTRGIDYPDEPLNQFYNCVAVSTSGDPTGSYYRYAFSTGYNFPDYPKLSVWKDSYVITTREFGIEDPNIYGIGVYGLERSKMIEGLPNARSVGFLLRDGVVPLNLIGDGLLPADLDGRTKPKADAPIPIVGTQDDNYGYGAPFDALNIWELLVKWHSTPTASLTFKAQLPVAPFDSDFPCSPTSRDCLPQPGISDPNQYLDVLSYRQRPTWRLAYRNRGTYESMVTSQSVEAAPGQAGMRWYEIRRVGSTYSLYQQGTYAPADGVHRWMGSAAADRFGNIAMGYSVVDAVSVYPGIRYTGRLVGDPLGQLTLGEGTIVDGSGAQTTLNSRWGDYTSLNLDPVDDCTFWYLNEYYTAAGQAAGTNRWQTRIASFKLPGC
ncbi:MAG TPA: hypothetical protein VGJ41_12855 [Nocardioides sp.]